MYANHKDAEIRGAFSVSVTGAISESVMDLRNSNRICDEFSVMAAGYATKNISPTFLNGGFETLGGGGADVFANWVDAAAGTSVISQTAVGGEFHGGTKALKAVLDATHGIVSETQSVLTIGAAYTVSLWAKGSTGGEKVEVINNVTSLAIFTLTNAYALYSVTFTATHADIKIASANDAANNSKTFFLDDVTVLASVAFERTPTSLVSKLEASLDGVHWTSLQAIAQTDNGAILVVANKPVQNFRFNVTTLTLAEASDYVTFSILAT